MCFPSFYISLTHGKVCQTKCHCYCKAFRFLAKAGSGPLAQRLRVTRWGQEGIRSCGQPYWWLCMAVDLEEMTSPCHGQEHRSRCRTSASGWPQHFGRLCCTLRCWHGCSKLPEVATTSFHRASKTQVWYNKLIFFCLLEPDECPASAAVAD